MHDVSGSSDEPARKTDVEPPQRAAAMTTPIQAIPTHISALITWSVSCRGGWTHDVVGRRVHASASAGALSVRRLIQRICVREAGPPQSHRALEADHARQNDTEETSSQLADVRREQEAQELADVGEDRRPSRTAVTIVAKLSSARIMSAASLVTSVP